MEGIEPMKLSRKLMMLLAVLLSFSLDQKLGQRISLGIQRQDIVRILLHGEHTIERDST